MFLVFLFGIYPSLGSWNFKHFKGKPHIEVVSVVNNVLSLNYDRFKGGDHRLDLLCSFILKENMMQNITIHNISFNL